MQLAFNVREKEKFKATETDRFHRVEENLRLSTKQRLFGDNAENSFATEARASMRHSAAETASKHLQLHGSEFSALSPQARRLQDQRSQVGNCFAKEYRGFNCVASRFAPLSQKPTPPFSTLKADASLFERSVANSASRPSVPRNSGRGIFTRQGVPQTHLRLRIEKAPDLERRELLARLRDPALGVILNAESLNARAGETLRVAVREGEFEALQDRFRTHGIEVSLAKQPQPRLPAAVQPNALDRLLCRQKTQGKSVFRPKVTKA